VTDGRILYELFAPAAAGQPIRTETKFTTPDLSVGLAGTLAPGITAGIVAGFGWAPTHNVTSTVDTTVLPSPEQNAFVVIPAGTVLNRSNDMYRSWVVRAGIGMKPDPTFGIYGDLDFASTASNASGSANVGRAAVGMEFTPSPEWSLRGGVSVATASQVNWSAGVGYRFDKNVEAQVAYQNNAAPEINPEWGRTKLLGASVALRF
jgi:hypothetical protein